MKKLLILLLLQISFICSHAQDTDGDIWVVKDTLCTISGERFLQYPFMFKEIEDFKNTIPTFKEKTWIDKDILLHKFTRRSDTIIVIEGDEGDSEDYCLPKIMFTVYLDIFSEDIKMESNLHVGMSQVELLSKLKIPLSYNGNYSAVVAITAVGDSKYTFFLQNGRVVRIKMDEDNIFDKNLY